MKVPEIKKIVTLYVHVDHNECLFLLDVLKEKLPQGIGIEDVVLIQSYDEPGPEEESGHITLKLGYIIDKKTYNKSVLEKQIAEEEGQILRLEEDLEDKKKALNKKRSKI